MVTPRTLVSSFIRLFGRILGCAARVRPESGLGPEGLLLQEAEITAPIAPGMAGRVAVRRRGVVLEVSARAEDADQAFARGMRVRLIDYRDGSYLVEAADVEHLVH